MLEYVESCLAEGARITTGGHAASLGGGLEGGYFVEPAVFAVVTPEMRISREEIFGPILCILRYDDLDETLSLANNTEFGLGGLVVGQDAAAALNVADRMGLRGHQLLQDFGHGTGGPGMVRGMVLARRPGDASHPRKLAYLQLDDVATI